MSADDHKVVSFDLDGTLVEHDFNLAVWREAIPSLIARQRGLPLHEAKTWVYREYDRVGEGSLAWYDLAYWYDRFDLEEDWRQTLQRHRALIRLFPDVREVLETLGRTHRMIILSNASHPFIETEIEEGGLLGLFERVVSATSDFGEVKKTREFYTRVCRTLDVDPRAVVHVGDHWEFDYLAPSEAGIRAYYLDRSGRRDGPGVVHDLYDFASKVLQDGRMVPSRETG